MDHQDHVHLLRGGIPQPGGVWADFGSGSGAFTLALAECIGAQGEIYSVDKNGGELQRQQQVMCARFPAVMVHYLTADFTHPLPMPALDGSVAPTPCIFCAVKAPLNGEKYVDNFIMSARLSQLGIRIH
jgi:hypothetical protein